MVRRVALLVLVCLPGILLGCSRDSGPSRQKVVCLYSDGAAHYEALCRVFISQLREDLGDRYSFSATSKLDEADGPDGAEAGSTPGRTDELTGAMDILDAIASRESDLETVYIGFTQSDVAYYFRHGGHPLYPTAHSRQTGVVSLARLFPEYLHLLAPPSTPIDAGAQSFSHQSGRLYVGSLGSGTLISSLNILSTLAGLEQGDSVVRRRFFWDRSPTGEGQDPSWGGTLVAGLGQPIVQELLDAKQAILVSLKPEEERHLRNAFSQFYRVVPVTSYGRKDLVLLEIPALLVASKRLPADVVGVLQTLLQRVDSDAPGEELKWQRMIRGFRNAPEGASGAVMSDAFAGEVYRAVHGIDRSSRSNDLILSPHRAILERRKDSGSWELLIALLASLSALGLGRKAVVAHRQVHSFLELSPWLTASIAFCLSVAWLHLSLWLVWQLDLAQYLSYKTDITSQFIEKSYAELLPMVVHYIASIFSAEKLFPVSRLGQLVWLSIPVLMGASALVGVVHVVVPPIIGLINRHLQEEDIMDLSDHFVICNWHANTEEIIRQLWVQDRLAGRGDPTIVLITPKEDEVQLPKLGKRPASNLPEHTLYALPPAADAHNDEGILRIIGFQGDPESDTTLRVACPELARAVILFPNLALENPDSATVLAVLRLQEIIGEESPVQVLVWCADSRNVPVFLDSRFRLTDVCSSEWAWRVICQATRVSHVSNLYRHLMTSSADTNEFYEFQLPGSWKGGSFRELQEAIVRFNDNGCGSVPGCESLRNTILLVGYIDFKDQRRQDIHINPPPDTQLAAGDFLVFLTYVFNPGIAEHLGAFLGDQG